MKHDWEYKKLGESCILTMGQSPSSDSYNSEGEGLPFFQGCSDFGLIHPTITTFCTAPTKIAQADDVLMSVRAPIGTLNIADVECCIGRGLASFRANNDGVSKFLYYVLKYSKDKLQSLGTGSTFKAIGKDSLRNFIIPVPPLPIQEQIVSELDKVSEIIEKKKQQVKELDALAQSIFYDMFGDPVENEKGWEVKLWKSFGKIINGFAFNSKLFRNSGIPVLKIGNINTGTLRLENVSYYDHSTSLTKYEIYPNDIVLSLTGTAGKDDYGNVCVIPENGISKYYLNQRNAKLDSNGVLLNILIKHIFANPHFKKELTKGSNGIRQGNILNKDIENLRIPIPPLPLQKSFAQKIEAIEKQKELINQSIKEAQTLFDARMDYWFGE